MRAKCVDFQLNLRLDMKLSVEQIRNCLIDNYGFEPILKKDGTLFKKLHKLRHKELDHSLHIDRTLKNHKTLAVPLKYHIHEDAFNKIAGLDKGNISHHQGFDNYWDHIGSNPYKPKDQVEPPAQHYGFSNVNALKEFMEVILNNKRTLPINIDESSIAQNETEKDALIKARIGQGAYRTALLDYWKGCAVTGCTVEALLVSSHIKPWSADKEARLDPFNGLLLSPTLDRAFDNGLISFNDDGLIMLSPQLTKDNLELLHLSPLLRLRWVAPEHLPYLAWHRANLFKA